MTRTNDPEPREQQPPMIIRDKRRIDPNTLELREPDQDVPEREGGEHLLGTVDRTAAVEAELDERGADLQRLRAEYDDYREQVQHDRRDLRDSAVASVLSELLPVLDAVDRARGFGEIGEGLQGVTDVLEERLADLGLETVGSAGEPYDPTIHEAVDHRVDDEVEQPTCTAVLRPGYRVGRRLLRPAQVSVSDPPEPRQEQEP